MATMICRPTKWGTLNGRYSVWGLTQPLLSAFLHYHIYTRTYTHARIHTHNTHAHIYAHIVNNHTHAHKQFVMWVSRISDLFIPGLWVPTYIPHARTRTHTHTLTHTLTHSHARTHTHTHTHMHRRVGTQRVCPNWRPVRWFCNLNQLS